MTPEEEKEFDEKFVKEQDIFGSEKIVLGGTPLSKPKDVKNFISQLLQQREKELVEKIIKMLETTDVQMSVNGDVSQDEKAMAKLIYKAHINHIKKKLKTYGK